MGADAAREWQTSLSWRAHCNEPLYQSRAPAGLGMQWSPLPWLGIERGKISDPRLLRGESHSYEGVAYILLEHADHSAVGAIWVGQLPLSIGRNIDWIFDLMLLPKDVEKIGCDTTDFYSRIGQALDIGKEALQNDTTRLLLTQLSPALIDWQGKLAID